MQPLQFLSRKAIIVSIAVVAVAVVGVALAFEPVTRDFVAQDGVCLYCHAPFDEDLLVDPRHPQDTAKPAADCADCHVTPGFTVLLFTYGHLASFTDFYGSYRSAYAERAGNWVAPLARRSHRVRDGYRETGSASCRTCHDYEDIKPKKKRGQRSHQEAVDEKLGCINCHYNLVHREIEPRKGFVK